MSEQNWTYTYNTFDVSTRSSAKKMSILAPDHKSKLDAESLDPEIAAIALETQSPVSNFADAYGHWISTNGTYKGETNRFTNLLNELSSLKIKQWDAQIQVVHLEGTSDYIALLPNGRGPFQKGAYDVRLAEVWSLAERLNAYPALSALQTSVQAYHATLLNARDVQQQKEGLVKQASEALNTARMAIAKQMYKNLGALMVKFFENPTEIERFFDLELLRSHTTSGDNDLPEPTVGTVGAGQWVNVLNAGFSESSIITITNNGLVPLLFYLANDPMGDITPPSLGIVVEPGSSSTHNVLEFGASFTAFLNVKNLNAATIGSFEVMVN